MSSPTTNGSSSHVATTNTSDMEIPTIFGLPWVTPTFDPSVTDVVPTMHTSSYPTINPALNPLLSQAGKTVLITGATAGIGFAMAKSFVTASASKVIITGRRQARLDEAVGLLRQHAKELGKQTEVEGEVVDVLILNSVGEMATGGLCEEGGRTTVEIWAKLEANLRGPMRYTELFMKQGKDRQKYGFTKATAGLFFRYIAQRSDPEKMQVVSIHPGTIYSELWRRLGVEKSVLPFDDISLPADFVVWAATKEARFIHGRFVWANWDVEELKAKYAERFKQDAELFRFGVCGLAGSKLHVIQ
ncbi:uncharacterized protein B0T23DRAFT_441245 [Neurospora hispaniola]|uniref:NAD(P)-binding protein n=1 Tax=Neurospora hispaniola TaxID=588809 RepID=A0AAJ0IB88_9PEZI|nr:hypothetical protein B0T23DRAFT_441245 [Neurospora hispaniola]